MSPETPCSCLRAVVDAERVDVDALFEDKGAFLAQGLLKVEVRARDPAMKGLPGVCRRYGLERSIGGPLEGMLSGEERQFWGVVMVSVQPFFEFYLQLL